MEKIKIKYFTDIPPIEKNGDWIDLRCAEDITLFPGDYRQIPLGIAVQLPHGYEAIVAPRSSTFKNWGILAANSIGIIDEDYCGNNDQWHFPVYATRQVTIRKGDRICQFRILWHMQDLDIQTVEELTGPDRGGFGSTGIR
jgi:dUTP pyrophosphatase